MRSPLVGRAAEYAGLLDALARCRSGEGGLVLVSGDSGVGKSRLVADVLEEWDGRVLRGAATPGAGGYAPVEDALRARSDEAGQMLSYHRADQAALLDGIQRIFRDIGREQPTVVVLEDLHWAGAAAVDLLPALAVAMAREPLLLIGTYRGEELSRAHAIRRMRTALRRGGRFVEYALRPLAAEQSGELLAGLLGAPPSPALVSAVHGKAEGLPFYVEELTAALGETGGLRESGGSVDISPNTELPVPESVLDAVLVRTAELRQRHRAAVELAAVLGVRVDLLALADIVEPQDVDELLDSGLLTELEDDPGWAEFRHALVRDALYRSIPWARRWRHHHLIAEHLSARGAPPETVAEHWIAAHEPERAKPLLLAAAERHCTVHAYRDAATLARRALAVWPEDADPEGRLAALERLADCAELCGELESAVAVWTDVARIRDSRGDMALAGAAHRRLANAAGLLGDWPRAVTERERAADAYAAAGMRGEAAAERLTLADQLKSAARLTEGLDQAMAAAEDAEAAGRADLKARALAMQGSLCSALGDGRRGVELARSGLALALAGQVPEATGEAYYELGEALGYAADYPAAADAIDSAIDLCRAHGVTELGRVCFTCLSPVVRLMGDWNRSLAICGEVLGDGHTPQVLRMVAEEESGLITVLRGDPRHARGPLRRSAAFGRDNEIFGMEVGATWGLAMVAELDDEEGTARHTVSAMLERCSLKEEWHYALPALRWAATFLAERGDGDGLAQCHRLLATAATQNSSPKVLAALAHASGELALADGDTAHASAHFGRAVDLLRDVTAPYEQALTQLRRGAALAGEGNREAAVSALTSAYRTAHRLGAKPLTRRCAARLADMGEQVDRRLGRLAARSLEPAGLTRREKEVLHLLADGRTNREIARALFISTRTVDMHVRNVLDKLGCSSRVAAARRAVELGLTGPPEALAGQLPKVRQ
ncbi:helix-turn-helix transcriptional regulator [Streptomyces spiramyceticus]|uniref:helix-turn-helix transcriptional regulator n=1 Tax=Streptomyces spiramyceticus TaxID=299717 RepID=UPI00237A4B65|nr:helix-turn-helix transcriptional regulator [Streptomyces spiramyceticus]